MTPFLLRRRRARYADNRATIFSREDSFTARSGNYVGAAGADRVVRAEARDFRRHATLGGHDTSAVKPRRLG